MQCGDGNRAKIVAIFALILIVAGALAYFLYLYASPVRIRDNEVFWRGFDFGFREGMTEECVTLVETICKQVPCEPADRLRGEGICFKYGGKIGKELNGWLHNHLCLQETVAN